MIPISSLINTETRNRYNFHCHLQKSARVKRTVTLLSYNTIILFVELYVMKVITSHDVGLLIASY